MLNIFDYNSVLNPARMFFDSASKGQDDEANKHLETFFDKANKDVVVKPRTSTKVIDISGKVINNGGEVKQKFNPSIARMALQQAQCDIYAGHTMAYLDEAMNNEEFKALQKKRLGINLGLNRTKGLIDLEKRIKEAYPKTYKKRLTIIPLLQDGVQVILRNKSEGVISQTEKVFGEDFGLACVKEFKNLKKRMYLIRKFFTR